MVWYLLSAPIIPLIEYEQVFLREKNLFGLIKARICSVLSMVIVVFPVSSIVSLIMIEVLEGLKLPIDGDFQRWWLIPMFFLMPSSVPLITNIVNRSFNYSEKLVNILEVLCLTSPNISSTKFLYEMVLVGVYVLGSSILSIYALTNFMKETTIMSLFKNNFSDLSKVLTSLHFVIYVTMRALVLPESTTDEKFIKFKRKFYLWMLATLATFTYMEYKILSSHNIIDYVYMVFAFLISVDRLVSSYKDLRNIVEEKFSVILGKSHIA